MKLKKLVLNLGVQIFIAMFAGIGAGFLMKEKADMFAPLGELFIKLLMMLVIPLISVSIISGAASLGRTKSAGKLGLATVAYYLGTTAFAVVLGLVFANVFKPGVGIDLSAIQSMFESGEIPEATTAPGFWETVKGFVPFNPFEAFATGNVIQVLFFCLLVGLGISTLKQEKREFLSKCFDNMTEALIWVIGIVMRAAPIGVFALMADAVGTCGFDILGSIIKLLVVYTMALLVHTLGVFSLTIKLFSRTSVKHFFVKMLKPQLFAFTTSSSLATLPVTFEVCEEELGVSKETASFVLPLGATVNMNGNAIYFGIVAVFFAQLFGIELGFSHYAAIIFTATLGSVGSAGVPGPCLLIFAVLLSANIPLEGIPLVYAVDRLFDMMRTTVNITGDAACAVVVDGITEAK